MSRAIITESKLTAIADAIRAKTGGSAELTVDEMASETNGLKLIYGYSSGSSELYQYAELPNGYRTKGSSYQRFICLNKQGDNAIFNPNNSTSFIVCAKIRLIQKDSTTRMLFGASRYSSPPLPVQIYFNASNKIGIDCINANNTYFSGGGISTDVFSTDTWYYVVDFYKDGKNYTSVLANDFTEIATNNVDVVSWGANSSLGCGFGGAENNNNWKATNIDFDVLNCFVKVDDTVVWGVPNKGILDYIQGGTT